MAQPEQNIFSGSFVDWTHEEIEAHIETIAMRVRGWRPASGRWAAFDGAVYAVCCATLAEAEEWRRVFGRPKASPPNPPAQASLDAIDITVAGIPVPPHSGDAIIDPRPAWESAAAGMGLRVTRPSMHHVQFRHDETGTVEADWWPGTGRLKIHGFADGAIGTWTDVRTGERALHLLRQA